MDYDLSDLLDLDTPAAALDALPATVHESQLATLLGISRAAVAEQGRNGVTVRAGRARYDLVASVQRYTAHLRTHAARAGRPSEGGDALKQARTRLAEEQASLAALKVAEAQGRLVDAGDVTRQWETLLTDLRAALLAVPGRLPGIDRDTLTRVDGEIRAALLELAERG